MLSRDRPARRSSVGTASWCSRRRARAHRRSWSIRPSGPAHRCAGTATAVSRSRRAHRRNRPSSARRARGDGHEDAEESLVDPHAGDAGHVARELRLQAGGAGEGEGGSHATPEEGWQHGTERDLARVGFVALQVQCRAAEASSQRDGHASWKRACPETGELSLPRRPAAAGSRRDETRRWRNAASAVLEYNPTQLSMSEVVGTVTTDTN